MRVFERWVRGGVEGLAMGERDSLDSACSLVAAFSFVSLLRFLGRWVRGEVVDLMVDEMNSSD